jgi:hypothetical protein
MARRRPHAASFLAFPNNRRRYDIARIEFIDKPIAVGIDEMASLGTDAFRYQRAKQLLGIDGSRGVILKSVDL